MYSIYMTTTVQGKEKLAMFWLVFFHFLTLINQLPYMFSGTKGEDFAVFSTTVLTCAFLWVFVTSLKSTSDLYRIQGATEIKPNTIYLVLKRPKSWTDYFVSMFGSPVSSVSFSIGDRWIKYTKRNGCAEEFSAQTLEDRHGYTFIETDLNVTTDRLIRFNHMLHKPWTIYNNCVTSWEPFLDGSHYEHKPWEWLPSVYIARIIKEVNK